MCSTISTTMATSGSSPDRMTDMQQANEYLRELYLDFLNNYLTSGVFADHHGLSVPVMVNLLVIGQTLHEEYVEEAKRTLD